MKKHILYIYIIGLYFLSCTFIQAQECTYSNYKTVKFPVGMHLKGYLENHISTKMNKLNDPVVVLIPYDLRLGELTVIPERTKIVGKITLLNRAVKGRNGLYQVVFDKLVFPSGQIVSILAHVDTKNKDSIIGGQYTKKSGYKKIIHNVERIGSYVQAIPSGDPKIGKETITNPGTEWLIVFDDELEFKINMD